MAEFSAMHTEALVPRNLRFSDRTTPADLVSISDADLTHPPRTECARKMSPDIDILVVSHARDRATIERFLQDSGVLLQSRLIQEIRGAVVGLQEAANLADDFRVAYTRTG